MLSFTYLQKFLTVFSEETIETLFYGILEILVQDATVPFATVDPSSPLVSTTRLGNPAGHKPLTVAQQESSPSLPAPEQLTADVPRSESPGPDDDLASPDYAEVMSLQIERTSAAAATLEKEASALPGCPERVSLATTSMSDMFARELSADDLKWFENLVRAQDSNQGPTLPAGSSPQREQHTPPQPPAPPPSSSEYPQAQYPTPGTLQRPPYEQAYNVTPALSVPTNAYVTVPYLTLPQPGLSFGLSPLPYPMYAPTSSTVSRCPPSVQPGLPPAFSESVAQRLSARYGWQTRQPVQTCVPRARSMGQTVGPLTSTPRLAENPTAGPSSRTALSSRKRPAAENEPEEGTRRSTPRRRNMLIGDGTAPVASGSVRPTAHAGEAKEEPEGPLSPIVGRNPDAPLVHRCLLDGCNRVLGELPSMNDVNRHLREYHEHSKSDLKWSCTWRNARDKSHCPSSVGQSSRARHLYRSHLRPIELKCPSCGWATVQARDSYNHHAKLCNTKK
ncbi:hypothetical protein SCP_0602860 [Sparassis crispa]|uniref:Uncharacterized protein n=1 Tax=Sparassis crispa TaxID=139825 RepID=A0A401GQ15_9APHY|nr:hypothetical protein SCP_0602860 [Sparassis crispa]GBE84308.1 hypothetical protein SCP_0602860 [Sparassis crispa]